MSGDLPVTPRVTACTGPSVDDRPPERGLPALLSRATDPILTEGRHQGGAAVESAGTRETDRQFAGSIPETYDRYLGPLLFEPYARDLAARLAALAPARVLETAAGTGVATRALVRALPAGTVIVATDLNRPMLDLAAARLETAEVAWQQADALALPFGDGTFDAVACQFGAMFFPDKAAGYREARRVLRRGGRLVLSVWDRIGRNELAHVVDEAVAALFPDDPPRFLARVPYGYHDADAIIDELRTAGFVEVAVETVARRGRAPSPLHPAVGLCQGTPLRAEIEARAPGRLGGVTDAAARAVPAHLGGGPADSGQQAPLIVAAREATRPPVPADAARPPPPAPPT